MPLNFNKSAKVSSKELKDTDEAKSKTIDGAKKRRSSEVKGFQLMTDAGVSMHEREMRNTYKKLVVPTVRRADTIDDFEDDVKMEPDTSISKFEVINKVDGRNCPITSMAMTSDGKTVVFGTVKTTLKKAPVYIHDLHTGLKAEVYRNNMIVDLVMSQDDTEVVLSDADGFIVIVDISNGHELFSKKLVHTNQATCVAYLKFGTGADPLEENSNTKDVASPVHKETGDGANSLDAYAGNFTRIVALGDSDGNIHVVWPELIRPKNFSLSSLDGEIKPLGDSEGFSESKEAAPVSSDNRKRNKSTFKIVGGTAVLDVALAKAGDEGVLLAVGSECGKALLYNIKHLEAGKDLGDFEPLFEVSSTRGVCTICLSLDGNYLGVGSVDKTVQVVQIQQVQNANTSKVLWEWEQTCNFTMEEQVSSVHFSKNGGVLAVGDDASNASIYCTQTGAFLHHYKRKDRIKRVMLSADGNYLAVGGFDCAVAVYNNQSGIAISSSSTQPKAARSVSLSLDGQRMAISNHAKRIVVYDIHFGEVLCEFERTSEVWVVALSDDGKTLAAAGYDGICKMYSVERGSELGFDLRHKAFIWSVAFLHNANHKKIAVGDWNGLVKIYNSDIGEELSSFSIPDRVFSLSITRDGNTLAVGGRNNLAAVYDVKDTPRRIHYFLREDRVYTVAISSDGAWLAAAGMDKKIGIYDLQSGLQVKSFQRQGALNYLAFSLDGQTLAAVGTDHMLVLYDMKTMMPCLSLPQTAVINSVAFSETGVLALAVGLKVIVYGKTRHSYHIRDRPTFSTVAGLLHHSEEMKILTQSHPTIPNVRHPTSNKTLLQLAVEKGYEDTVAVFLSSSATIGLMRDENGNTAVSIAVKQKKKGILQMLLQAILDKRISNMPGSLAAVIEHMIVEDVFDSEEREPMTVFNAMGQAFPDLLLFFLTQLKEEESELQVMGTLKEAPIRQHLYVACTKRVPGNLWEPFVKQQTFGEDDFGVRVVATRIPIKNFATSVPLGIVTKYAETTGNFDVFAESSVVSAIIRFKWGILGKVFFRQFLIYLVYLVCAMFWCYYVSATQAMTWKEILKSGHGIIALALSPIILIGSLKHLHHEFGQIIDEHQQGRSYFSVMARYFSSFWNILDLPSLTLMLVNLVFFCLRLPTRFTGSVGILLMCLKVLFFVRAFGHWGLVVRTLQKIVNNVLSLFHILIIIIIGFGMAFMVLMAADSAEDINSNFSNLWSSFISVTLLVYGEFSPLEDELGAKDYTSLTNIFVIVLFEIFTFFAVLALLNVVIANMTDSYEQVKENAALETQLELAKIIVELENSTNFETHPWLHCLKPVETDLVEEDHEQKTERLLMEISAKEKDLQGQINEISKQLFGLASKIEKLSANPSS